ncbi:MAG: protein translocase subunit SecD, partial [Deltaproteobacteria bacterium]
MKTFQWKHAITLGVLIVAVIYILPTINPELWPKKRINLGLDLQGGIHLVLEVQTEKAVETRLASVARDLKDTLRKERVRHVTIEPKGMQIYATVTGMENIDRFSKILDKEFRNLTIISSSTESGTLKQVMSLPAKEIERIKKMATEQALETIRNRIDQFGVSEPTINIQGENQILVQLPGVTNPQRAKELIGKTAQLEFRLVDEEHDINRALEGNIPAGSEILYQITTDPETGRTIKRPFLVKRSTPLTGADLVDARVMIDSQYNEPYVAIEFNRKGAAIFARITGENIKKRLAIVLDNHVYSAPVIQDRITGGSARITGNFSD